MKLEPLSLSTVLVAIPFVHLVVTSAYLLCYCIGFGGNFGAFIAVEDVFSTSLTQVAPIYVSALLFPSLISFWRHSWKHPYEADRVAAIEDPVRQRHARLNLAATRWALGLISVVGLVIILVRMFDAYLRAAPIPVVSLTSLSFVFGPIILGSWLSAGKISSRTFEVGVVAIFFVASALGSGVSKGQSDRLLTYSDLQTNRPSCGDYLVLRMVSGQMLAVGSRNERVLLDAGCRPVVEFSKPLRKGYLRWAWRPIVYYRS